MDPGRAGRKPLMSTRDEASIRASESRLRTLIDTIPDMVWMKDCEGVYLDCNERFERFVGVRKGALIGHTDYDFFATELADFFREHDRKALAAGRPTANEERVTFADDGHQEDLETLKTPILAADGTILGVLGIGRNISARKQAERALEESRANLTALIGSTHDLIWSVDMEGRFLITNPAFMKHFKDNYGTVPQVGAKASDFLPAERGAVWPSLYQRLRDQGPFRLEYQLTDGRTLEMAFHPIRNDQEAIGVSVFGKDITERKRAEGEILNLKSHLASIIDSMPVLLVGLDPEGRVSQWNRQAETVSGITAAAACGRPLAELLPEFTPWVEALRQEVAEHGLPASRENLLLQREGEGAYYDIMLYPLVTSGVPGAVLRIEDVTERTRIRELMIQTEKMMSLGGLAAGMAHEINNPLGIISQAAQNIGRRLSPELPANRAAAEALGLDLTPLKPYFEQRKIPEFISSIQIAVDRASKIVGNMLQFSRRPDSARALNALTEVVDQAIELAGNDYDLKKKFDFRSIEIQRSYQPDLPPIPMVAIEIEQVVLNLLKNAAQALVEQPPGQTPRIELRIHRDGGHLLLEVEDNGPGMTAAVRRRIFDPFFTTKEPGVGTGLGLSVSYMIITQNHKGLLEVDSAPGRGARFTVRLPLAAGDRHG